jgi:hypothetical protein
MMLRAVPNDLRRVRAGTRLTNGRQSVAARGVLEWSRVIDKARKHWAATSRCPGLTPFFPLRTRRSHVRVVLGAPTFSISYRVDLLGSVNNCEQFVADFLDSGAY